MTDAIDRFERLTDAPRAPAVERVVDRSAAPVERNLAVGYLRAFITVLVLAHHAVIAYLPGMPKAPAVFGQRPFTWGAFPVLDTHSWAWFGLLTGFNDTFFMSLMFFISGLFVWDSLKRKGAAGFLRDRLLRLGLPFAVAATLLAPLAYYPSYRLTGADPSPLAFAKARIGLGSWPAGPAWFIWVLLVFGALAAAVWRFAPALGEAAGRLAKGADARPFRLYAGLLGVSAVAYGALALVFGQIDWLAFGPFSIQGARILHYGVYFAAGLGVGAIGLAGGLLAENGALQRRWWAWALAAPFAFAVDAVLNVVAFLLKAGDAPAWQIATSFGYALSCATASFAFMAVFVRFVRRRSPIWDSLAANAYGMYLIHYIFVTWLQYALLRSDLPGFTKGVLVFAGVVALTWAGTAALRRAPGLGRVL
ncbi:MAG TPA: acyltransferase [Caulobacteraceae bacterium]|nr:acyltransferase [Caulobacteraceae bacterium]